MLEPEDIELELIDDELDIELLRLDMELPVPDVELLSWRSSPTPMPPRSVQSPLWTMDNKINVNVKKRMFCWICCYELNLSHLSPVKVKE